MMSGRPEGEPTTTTARSRRLRDQPSERGAGIVEWLGISALSIGMLVVVFAAVESLGLDIVSQIRASLGL